MRATLLAAGAISTSLAMSAALLALVLFADAVKELGTERGAVTVEVLVEAARELLVMPGGST